MAQRGEASNVFERHPAATITVAVLVLALVIEGAAWLVLAIYGKTAPEIYPYNRTLSGYYVFKSTPNFTFRTIRGQPDDPDASLDEHGFLSDAPVNLEKPEGVIRIFLMGGSALFGAGQAARYGTIHKYPGGGMIYTYRLSIAGQLERILQERFGAATFEVITAAAFTRTLHQSMLYYLETVSRFSPDYVVNVDGYNDVPSLTGGEPYAYKERGLRSYAALLQQYESNRWLKDNVNFVHLLWLIERRLKGPPQIGFEEAEKSVNSLEMGADPAETYRSRRQGYVENAERFLQIFDHYAAVLNADDVGFVFVLQPMLDRLAGNKPLSEIERQMAERFGRWHGGPEQQEDGVLVLRYFFDDHVSGALANHSERWGARYVDAGERMRSLDASVQFYTDYCHLTPEANTYLASLIADSLGELGLAEKVAPAGGS